MENNRQVEYREADEIHETHANMFQIAPAGELVALYCGEQEFTLQPDGSSEATEVVYDTKIKLTPESARALQDLLEDVLENEDDGTDRHVQ